MFPARAGMSPQAPPQLSSKTGVPRASGDEPGFNGVLTFVALCSPRERG